MTASSASLPPAGHPAQGAKVGQREWSPRRLNRIGAALGARSYLEIGVAAGNTFHAVTIPERTGVDLQFQFDIEAAMDARTVLKPMTSDAFFAELSIHHTFDVIYLDGLHTVEQTYRDLC